MPAILKSNGKVLLVGDKVAFSMACCCGCHCETFSDYIIAKAPDCAGDYMKPWCLRALRYTRDGATGALTDRTAFRVRGDSDVPACNVSELEVIDWFYDPKVDAVSDWLAAMDTPPPSTGSYQVTLFFECWRGMVDGDPPEPCGDETSSAIDLTGACYDDGSEDE